MQNRRIIIKNQKNKRKEKYIFFMKTEVKNNEKFNNQIIKLNNNKK